MNLYLKALTLVLGASFLGSVFADNLAVAGTNPLKTVLVKDSACASQPAGVCFPISANGNYLMQVLVNGKVPFAPQPPACAPPGVKIDSQVLQYLVQMGYAKIGANTVAIASCNDAACSKPAALVTYSFTLDKNFVAHPALFDAVTVNSGYSCVPSSAVKGKKA